MKVTIKNYQNLAYRTMANLKTKAADGMHMASGVTTELGEMQEGIDNNDRDNIREENGDAFWYVANACNIYGFNFIDLYEKRDLNHYKIFKLHDYMDLHKREFVYGKEIDLEKLEEQLIRLIRLLSDTAREQGFTIEDSLQRNINKLLIRFPDKFTKEKALNRDLKAELKTLKQ